MPADPAGRFAAWLQPLHLKCLDIKAIDGRRPVAPLLHVANGADHIDPIVDQRRGISVDGDLEPVLDVPSEGDGVVALPLLVAAGVAVTGRATPWMLEKEGPLAMITTAPTVANDHG